jgi:hypothetical protein
MRAFVAMLLVAFTLLPLGQAAQAAPGDARIQSVTVNGSGCPAGKYTAAIHNQTSFTVSYTAFVAKAGARTSPLDSRKNCAIGLRLSVPAGSTFAVVYATYAGQATLVNGASGNHSTNYYVQGLSPTTTVAHPFSGPRTGGWTDTDAATIRATCADVGRMVNINTDLRVTASPSNRQAVNSLKMTSTSGHVSTRSCS